MALPPHVLLAMSRQEQKRQNRRDINKAIGTVAPVASTAAGLVSAYNDGSYNPSVGLGAAAGAVQGGASALSSGAGIFGTLGFGALGAVTGAITSLNQKEKMHEQEQNRTNNRLYSTLVGNDIGLQEIMEAKKGGQAVPSEDTENPEQQMYIPVQTEADEMMAFADGSLQEVHATKKHSEMKKDHVTDVVPIGTYIFPESVKLSKKDLESLITYSVGDYSENGQDYKIEEVRLTTILGDKFEGSFADAARVIKRKYPVTVDKRGMNGITDKSNDENMKHRLTYINHLIRLNEAKLNKEKVEDNKIVPSMMAKKGGYADSIQHFKKGGDVDPKPKKKTVVGNNFDIILPETGPNIWSTPLQKQNVIIDKGEPTTPAAVGNTPSTPVPTNKKPTPSQKIVPTRPSWTPNKIPVRPKPSNSNLASRGADGRTVEIQKDKPISNADLLSSFLNKRPMVYSNSSITNKQRNKSYNDDVQDRLSLLYNSDEFKNASKFEQLGMMTEIDPISLFQEGLVTGISSIPIGRAFTALEKANNSYILKPAQAILKGKGSKNIKGWDSFFKKNGGYARLIQEAPRRYAAGSFVSGPGDPPKGKRYSNKKRGDFIIGEDGKGYLKVGDKWNPVSQQTYDAFSSELKNNNAEWAQVNNEDQKTWEGKPVDGEKMVDPITVVDKNGFTRPNTSNALEPIKSMFPRTVPQPKYSNKYGGSADASEFDPRLPMDETGIPKYPEIKGATPLQDGKSGLSRKPTSVINDDQNPYGYNEESGVGEYIGNMRPDSISSLVADATKNIQNTDSTNTQNPFDEANDMLDMRAQDAQYDAQVSRENYSDLFDRMGTRDTAQLITALGGLGLQDRTETANLKSPYYLAQKNQKFTAQEIKARQDATVGVGMEGLKQLGRTGETNMAANLAPVVYSQLIDQGSEIGENLSTYNKQQDQKYYNELGQIRTANDTEMARVQNVERDNNNKYIAGTTGTITEFMASRNDRDIDQVKVNEGIERDLTRKIYAVQNQKFDLKFRQMDYEDQMKDIETQRESLKAQVEEFAKTQNLPEGQKEKMLTRLESEYAALVQQMKIMQALSPTPKK